MLYVIAGNGIGNATEISAALKDLREAANQRDEEFWVLLEGKEDPTKTDEAIYKWLRANEVWFEVVTSTGIVVDGAQESVGTDEVYSAMLERINERAEENEPSALLVLPVDAEGSEDEDEPLMELIEQAIDADISVFQLNSEMARLTMDDAESAPPPPAKAATKKATAKAPAKAAAPAKKAAKRAAPTETEVAEAEVDQEVLEALLEDAEELAEAVVYTNEELTKMTVPELTAVAKGQGIDVKGLGKKDLIAAVQQMTAVPAVAALVVEEVAAAVNGEMVLVVVHLPGRFISGMVPAVDALALIAE